MSSSYFILCARKVLVLGLLAVYPLIGMTLDFNKRDPLAKAFLAGDLKAVKNILESKNAAVVANYPPEIIPDALDIAISAGHLNILGYLKSRGWLDKCKKMPDCTPVHSAATYGKVEVIKSLVSEGFDINVIAFESQSSALHVAAEFGYLGTVRVLCEQGLDGNLKNRYGQTPLEAAKDANKRGVYVEPREKARTRANLAKVIEYLESGQCKKK